MGGRGWTFEFYYSQFKNLTNLGCNIVIYSYSNQIEKIQNFFDNIDFSDYKIIEYDLNNFIYSDKIYSLKESQGVIDEHGIMSGVPIVKNDRNHHLCLSKPFFLKDAIEKQYFDSNKYYWIDAGLFHHTTFPESYGGMERLTKPPPERYWPLNKNNICNPELINRVENKLGNNCPLIFLGLKEHHSQHGWWSELFANKKREHIIGGFFGGEKESVIELVNNFYNILPTLLDKEILTLEEEILSAIYSNYINNPECISFNQWYHDIKGDPAYYGELWNLQPGSNNFYKIFI